MHARKSLVGGFSVLMLGSAVLLSSVPALAYTTCNSNGDCWHTDTRSEYPGVKFSYYEDNWWDSHKTDAQYHWHEADADHDWHSGYWNNGEWQHR